MAWVPPGAFRVAATSVSGLRRCRAADPHRDDQSHREIVDVVQIPIVSDAETGYGNVVNVVRAVREFERAGVAAIHIEDQMTPKRAGHEGFDVGVISKEEFVAKIKAAVDTRHDENMVIIARSEVKDSLQQRLERLQACSEAGADAVWVSGRSEEDVKAYGKIGKPIVGVPPRQVMTIDRYGELGGPRRLYSHCAASCGAARHAPMFRRAEEERHRGALLQGNTGDR